jgi:DNA adenine methylase
MKKQRSFLKWPGNKYRVLDKICQHLPSGTRLIEPFVGSGVVFLNTNYSKYLLSDVNPDLIQVYQLLQESGMEFVKYTKKFFTRANNQPQAYYRWRERFNQTTDEWKRSALFIYLNRHGYNGLCRYNRSGEFNVPFGRYREPYFPEEEMKFFYQKSQRNVKFICADFNASLKQARAGPVIYCDPPYVPLSATSNFTSYSRQAFSLTEQEKLAKSAEKLSKKGISVLISNHDTPFVRDVYQNAHLEFFSVSRTISCKAAKRVPAPELFA